MKYLLEEGCRKSTGEDGTRYDHRFGFEKSKETRRHFRCLL